MTVGILLDPFCSHGLPSATGPSLSAPGFTAGSSVTTSLTIHFKVIIFYSPQDLPVVLDILGVLVTKIFGYQKAY